MFQQQTLLRNDFRRQMFMRTASKRKRALDEFWGRVWEFAKRLKDVHFNIHPFIQRDALQFTISIELPILYDSYYNMHAPAWGSGSGSCYCWIHHLAEHNDFSRFSFDMTCHRINAGKEWVRRDGDTLIKVCIRTYIYGTRDPFTGIGRFGTGPLLLYTTI